MSAQPIPPCPCDTGLPYAACCGRWHAGPLHLQALDAQALDGRWYYVDGDVG